MSRAVSLWAYIRFGQESFHSVVEPMRFCKMSLGEAHGFLSGWYFLLSSRYAFFISLSEADLSILRSL